MVTLKVKSLRTRCLNIKYEAQLCPLHFVVVPDNYQANWLGEDRVSN